VRIIEGKLEEELLRIALLRSPHEAVGLILSNNEVIELPNHSSEANAQFEVHREDIVEALSGKDLLDIVFWHSHPSGGIGPSRVDIQQRTPFPHHLVIAIDQGAIVSSWY